MTTSSGFLSLSQRGSRTSRNAKSSAHVSSSTKASFRFARISLTPFRRSRASLNRTTFSWSPRISLTFRRFSSWSSQVRSFASRASLNELSRGLTSLRIASSSNVSGTRKPSQSARTRVTALYGADRYSATNAASPPGYAATRFANTAFVGATVRPRSTRPAWASFTKTSTSPGFGGAAAAPGEVEVFVNEAHAGLVDLGLTVAPTKAVFAKRVAAYPGGDAAFVAEYRSA